MFFAGMNQLVHQLFIAGVGLQFAGPGFAGSHVLHRRLGKDHHQHALQRSLLLQRLDRNAGQMHLVFDLEINLIERCGL